MIIPTKKGRWGSGETKGWTNIGLSITNKYYCRRVVSYTFIFMHFFCIFIKFHSIFHVAWKSILSILYGTNIRMSWVMFSQQEKVLYDHIHKHTHTHTHTHTTDTYTCACTDRHSGMCMHIYAQTHVGMHTCTVSHVGMHTCTVSHAHTDAQTHAHTHAHAFTHTHAPTHTHAHMHTQIKVIISAVNGNGGASVRSPCATTFQSRKVD